MSKPLPLCKCGCGIRVERATKRYYDDHFRHPVGSTIIPTPKIEEAIIKSISSEIKKEINKITKIAMKNKSAIAVTPKEKLPAIPMRGPKISSANLHAVGLGIYTC
jgi:hypothetical protein